MSTSSGMPHRVSGINILILSVNLIPVPLSLTSLLMLLPHTLTLSTYHSHHPWSLWHINRFPVPVSGSSQLVPETDTGFWYQLAWHTRPVSAATSIYRIFYPAVGNV